MYAGSESAPAPLMGAYFARRDDRVIIGSEIPLLQRAQAGRGFDHFQRSQTFKPQRSPINAPGRKANGASSEPVGVFAPTFPTGEAVQQRSAPHQAERRARAERTRRAQPRGVRTSQSFPLCAAVDAPKEPRNSAPWSGVCEFSVNAIDKPRGLCDPCTARR